MHWSLLAIYKSQKNMGWLLPLDEFPARIWKEHFNYERTGFFAHESSYIEDGVII